MKIQLDPKQTVFSCDEEKELFNHDILFIRYGKQALRANNWRS